MTAEMRTPAGAVVSELIISIFRLNGRLLTAGDALVEPYGLTSARWQVLGAIAMSPVPEPVARLARNMGLNRQGVQRIVGDLLVQGFVELKDNPHHRSAKLVVMTEQGQAAYVSALEAQIPWVNELAEGLAPDKLHLVQRVLNDLRSKLERAASGGDS